MTLVSMIIPTRDRNSELVRTIEAIGALDQHSIERSGGTELIVIDNASAVPVELPERLSNGVSVQTIRLVSNAGAAARNVGAHASCAEWLLMLDDDSAPFDTDFIEVCHDAPSDEAAIGGRITLPDGSRERGGLPEVLVGCGALVRREAFLDVRGYDDTFGYYAEEYDLCAKLMLSGARIGYDERLRVLHRKVAGGRDMNEIMRRITRNSVWVEQRYAPGSRREDAIVRIVDRYREISEREDARIGYEKAIAELAVTLDAQERTPMPEAIYSRFTGLAHAREAIRAARDVLQGSRCTIVGRGKQAWAVELAVSESGGCVLVDDPREAEVLIVGTLSPGPMFDAYQAHQSDGRPVVLPWLARGPVAMGWPAEQSRA